jgi:hypothetical protein
MKRFHHYLINGAAALSIGLWLASVALWARSYWSADRIEWGDSWPKTAVPNGTVQWSLESDSGLLRFSRIRVINAKSLIVIGYSSRLLNLRFLHSDATGDRIAGPRFGWRTFVLPSQGFYSRAVTQVTLPWQFVVIVLLIFAVAALRARRKRQIGPPGYCPKCGYDLRATPNRCPECGSIGAKRTS